MKLTLLGTGSPTPNPNRCGTGYLVEFGEDRLLIDCGWGVARRLVEARVDALPVIDTLLFTHHHFDHNVDFPSFVFLGWIAGRSKGLRVFGPRGTVQLTEDLFERGFQIDLQARRKRGSRDVTQGLIELCEDIDEDVVLTGDDWRITAARVEHFTHDDNYTLAYRLEHEDHTLVISSDTIPCPGIYRLADGADVLIHEVCWAPEIAGGLPLPGRLVPERENDPVEFARRRKHPVPEEVAEVAQRCGVKHLILTHLFSDADLEGLLAVVGKGFGGRITIAEDLDVVDLS